MKFYAVMTWTILLLAGCGGSKDGDLCRKVTCDNPPADSCKDQNTLLDYPDTGSCQAATGECQYTSVEKNCAGGCQEGRCQGSGDGFKLQIPQGTSLCSLFQSNLGGSDIQTDYAMKGRVTLKTGSFDLPVDQAEFDADWIDQVEFGPDRTVLDPQSDGRVVRTLQGSEHNGTYRYEYTHSFQAGDHILELVYRCDFVIQNGTPEKDTITLDPATAGNEWFDFSARLIDGTGQTTDERYYTGCGYPTYTMDFKHTLTMQNGDVLVMDQKMIGESVCKICNSGLVEAGFTSGGNSREVTDHFRLAYTAQHHNWYQNFLVVFDNPVGNIHGIHAEEVDFEEPAIEVRYLDQNLEVIESVPVSDYTRTSP